MTRISAFAFSTAVALLAALPAAAQQTFPTPEAASKALLDAAKAGEPGFVERIFGAEAKDLLSSGVPEEDKERLARFNAAAAESAALVPAGDAKRILRLGRRGFDFPFPIVRKGDAWTFDVAAGREELLNRTIGENELHAIEACRTFVEAQKEYFRLDRDDDRVPEYAQRILSSPGKRDGLYWPRESQSDISPLEGRIAQSVLERRTAGTEPYFGYNFRVLKAQGPAAPGGAHSYVINGNMIAGFALLAWPNDWGKSGVMTFICNQSGAILEKNLGPRTAEAARAITRFDPDPSWTAVD